MGIKIDLVSIFYKFKYLEFKIHMGTNEGRGHSGWKKRYSGDHTGAVGISKPQ